MSDRERHSILSPKQPSLNSLPRATAGRLSPFGKKLRRLRFENSKRIYDLAQDLHVSSSSVSAWETGRRDVSAQEIEKIGHIFNLNDSEIASLREAAELSRNRVIIEPRSTAARELANQVKKRINDLTSDDIQTIMSHLKWTRNGRTRWDCRVPQKSIHEIERVAHIVRRIMNVHGSQAFDVVKFYEEYLDSTFFHFLENDTTENTAFEVWEDLEMPKDTRGMTMMFPPHIVISNSVYETAVNGGPGDRWIMAHELGHLLLLHGFDSHSVLTRGPESLAPDETDHTVNIPFQSPKRSKKIPRSESAEMQADDFAGELLMPRQFCKGMLPHNIALRYEVSTSNAKNRLKFIGQRNPTFH